MRLPPFETIAKPHRDIQKGYFTADTYAASLGQVVKKQGPEEYRIAKQFFQRTYMTDGLNGLLSGVEGRLTGRERQRQDPIIQLQTPFGGGKTHTLIALYHRAREWDAIPITLVGSELDTTDTFWRQIESKLTGSLQHFHGTVAPGGGRLSEMFAQTNRPVLILMDEVLNYLERAGGVSVQRSTLADQTIAFMLSLTEAVAQSKQVACVVTLQERDVDAIKTRFPRFTDILQRLERTVTPVEDTEIASIIRQRLFSDVNVKEATKTAREFAKYAAKEAILPDGMHRTQYGNRFIESYPFLPEVIDVLYQRWGSFPDFQRTRGVLRLLSRVVYLARGKNRPYITLADFDLGDSDIRTELRRHIDRQYESVIDSDIAGRDAAAKTVDTTLGDTLGTRTATTIFLYSFTGGTARGTTMDNIKRSTALTERPASIIDTTINHLKEHLSYLRIENVTHYFDTQPNLNRLIYTRMENIEPETVEERMTAQVRRSFSKKHSAPLKAYLFPTATTDVPDGETLKLIVLEKREYLFCQNLIENRGEIPRINRNTLFFLVPHTDDASELKAEITKTIAYEQIKRDTSLNLSREQRREIDDAVKQANTALDTALRKDYRTVLIPKKDGFTEADLGLPATGMDTPIPDDVYELLRANSAVLSNIGPKNISLRYMQKRETLSTKQLHDSSLRTPGETRVLRQTWIDGIRQGVQSSVFALGEKKGDRLIPHAFNTEPTEITLSDNEVLIKPELIRETITSADIAQDYLGTEDTFPTAQPFRYAANSENDPIPLRDAWESAIKDGIRQGAFGLAKLVNGEPVQTAFEKEPPPLTFDETEVLLHSTRCKKAGIAESQTTPDPGGDSKDGTIDPDPDPESTPSLFPDTRNALDIEFTVPQGRLSNVAQQMGRVQTYFDNLHIQLKATEGEMPKEAYQEIIEALQELGITVQES